MNRYPIATLLLLTAALSFAQSPAPSIRIASSDVYVGYVVNVPDYSVRVPLNNFEGMELAYTLNH
ncbi:MAG: hypothetical protein WA830_18030, partial [Candidatus Sulfotelmatobacter sp.]